VTQGELRELIVDTAQEFADGRASIQDMWAAVHEDLYTLCDDGPLAGDFLAIFVDLERWESACGDAREEAVEVARRTAARLAAA